MLVLFEAVVVVVEMAMVVLYHMCVCTDDVPIDCVVALPGTRYRIPVPTAVLVVARSERGWTIVLVLTSDAIVPVVTTSTSTYRSIQEVYIR